MDIFLVKIFITFVCLSKGYVTVPTLQIENLESFLLYHIS